MNNFFDVVEEKARAAAKEITSLAAGAGLPVAVVAGAGEVGVSAVGITTGLATIGFGSMLAGVAVVGVVGVGAYYGTKALIEAVAE